MLEVTTVKRARRLGPKKVSSIRKLYSLTKEDDPRKYIVRRPSKNGKRFKAPKIQRLVTDTRIRRKKVIQKIKQERLDATKKSLGEYKKLIEARKAKLKAEAKSRKKSEGQKAAAAAAPSKKA
jgi:small subunit ribosomal protein S6e